MISDILMGLLFSSSLAAGHDIHVGINQYKQYKEGKALGAGMDTDPEREKLFRSDLESWWRQGKYGIVPQEYVGFLKVHSYARQVYFECLAADTMLLCGYRPMDLSPYKLPFEEDPYKKFNDMFRKSVKEWERIYCPDVAINELRARMSVLHKSIQNAKDDFKQKAKWVLLAVVGLTLFIIWLGTAAYQKNIGVMVFVGVLWGTAALMIGGDYNAYHQRVKSLQQQAQELAEVLGKPRPYDL